MAQARFRDLDIRRSLHSKLVVEHTDDTRIIHELGLSQGQARIDIAVVNSALTGYEIKSESDTLVRLPQQQHIYCSVFDHVTIVVGGNHTAAVERQVPEWWGISCASLAVDGCVEIHQRRPPGENPHIDPFIVAQLLWRDDALDVLADIGADTGLRRKPRREIWRRLTEVLDADELRAVVRQRLKDRSGWRSAVPRALDGDSCRDGATSSRSRGAHFQPRNRRYSHQPN